MKPAIGLVLILLFAISCAKGTTIMPEKPYTVLSSAPFDASICESTSGSAPVRGVELTIVDESNKELQGTGTISYENGGGSLNPGTWDCFGNGPVTVSVTAKGHTPKTIPVDVPANTMLNIAVPMRPSCSEDSSDPNTQVFADALAKAGITKYNLSCMEYSPGRSWFVKGKGTVEGPIRRDYFTFSYRSGWCSSGGSDCGYSLCVQTNDDALFKRITDSACHGSCDNLTYNDGTHTLSIDSYRNVTRGGKDCLGLW